MANSIGPMITQYCIHCHMPGEPSQTLTLQLKSTNNAQPAIVYTHDIAIYPNATKKVMALIQILQQGKLLLNLPNK